MKRLHTLLTASFVLLCCTLLLTGCNAPQTPITVYANATIYTCEDDLPQAQALVVQDGKILYVGDAEGAQAYQGKNVTVVDLQGKTILPGLMESHVHLASSGVLKSAGMIPLGYISLAEMKTLLKDYLKENPGATHLLGMGYSLDDLGLPEGKLPTKEDLDEVSTEIPILMIDEGGHSSFANSKALELAKVDEHTQDIKPGVSFFVRNPKNNKPTGYIFETTTFFMFNVFNVHDIEVISGGILDVLNNFSKMGFTGVFDAGGFFENEYDALAKIQEEGNLNVYYQKSTIGNANLSASENIDKLKELDKKYTKGNLYCNVYKLFEDGTLEVETNALIEPFASSGKITNTYLTEEQSLEHVTAALTNGYAVHTHAIGDKAQRTILDAYYKTKEINPKLTRTIAHNQLFEPEGVRKYEAMKEFIFCQSTPGWTVPQAVQSTLEKLGKERFEHQYLWGQLMRKGVNVTFGSDFPASPQEEINPFYQMYCAVMRAAGEGFFPPKEAGVTAEQALKAYTINTARQMMIEEITGSLKPGKFADFIVIDRDILKIAPQEIKDTQVEQTYFQGKLVQ